MALDDITAVNFDERVLQVTLAVGVLCWARTNAASRFMMPGLEEAGSREPRRRQGGPPERRRPALPCCSPSRPGSPRSSWTGGP
jgi:hypothetical protein